MPRSPPRNARSWTASRAAGSTPSRSCSRRATGSASVSTAGPRTTCSPASRSRRGSGSARPRSSSRPSFGTTRECRRRASARGSARLRRRRTSRSTGSTTSCWPPASDCTSRSGHASSFVAWWRAALAAGHLVYLEAWGPRGTPIAGLVLYRHGERLSTVHSGDRAEDRDETPGALHLLRWRAIQLAIREARMEMDLGGVDVAGARNEPHEGDPLYGLYQHKRSFGGEWLELAGAHERVYDARGYAARPADRPSRPDGPAMTSPTIGELPGRRRARHSAALGGLIDRLTTAGRLRGARLDGRAIGPAGLAGDRGPRASRTIRGTCDPAGSSWPSRGSTSTGTTTWRPPWSAAPRPPSSNGRSPSSPSPSSSSTPPGRRWPPRRRGGTATRATSWRSSGSPARTARRRPPSSPSPPSRPPGCGRG